MKQKHTQERKPDELLLHETKGPVYIGESSPEVKRTAIWPMVNQLTLPIQKDPFRYLWYSMGKKVIFCGH